MGYPKVIFEDTPEARKQYLVYLAKSIAAGFYQDRRFLILPRLIEGESRSVCFPNLPYPKQLLKELGKYSADDFTYFFPKEIISLVPSHPPSVICHSSIESRWRKTEKEFFDCVTEFLPTFVLSKINFIKVLPVEFGTVGSFYFEHVKNKYNFYHTIRTDFGPAQLAETILTQILWTIQPLPKLTLWYQKEAIVDFLMTNTRLGQIFDFDYQPTVSGLPEISENLASESEKYLTKLGFQLKPILPVGNGYTPTEKKIVEALIANKNKLITYDEIGDLFWGEDLDKFSLASIAKIMEKIRKKIKDHGIYQELIYTVRGEGYVLYD